MAKARKTTAAPSRATARKPTSARDSKSRETRNRPNRIYELMKSRHWTYADVAERVRQLAKQRNDISRAKVHELTINRLALGTMNLTQEWMELLGAVYAVPASELISAPIAENLRRITVIYELNAGVYKSELARQESSRFDIMIPDDAGTKDFNLYAAEQTGPDMNLRYPTGSIVIISKLTQRPGEIVEGKRYHVCIVRESDGTVESSIKLLHADQVGKFWLKPESNHPDHQAWMPLDGKPGFKVELLGRVRGVYSRED